MTSSKTCEPREPFRRFPKSDDAYIESEYGTDRVFESILNSLDRKIEDVSTHYYSGAEHEADIRLMRIIRDIEDALAARGLGNEYLWWMQSMIVDDGVREKRYTGIK